MIKIPVSMTDVTPMTFTPKRSIIIPPIKALTKAYGTLSAINNAIQNAKAKQKISLELKTVLKNEDSKSTSTRFIKLINKIDLDFILVKHHKNTT